MNDVLEKILKGLNGLPSKKEDMIKNLCKTASQINKKTEEIAEKKAIFYGKNSQLVVENHIIKDAFMYYDESNCLNIAINPKTTDSRQFYYYDSISKSFNDFTDVEKKAFLEWLEFFKYNEDNRTTPQLFLCIYFRNLQQRALVDEKNLNEILFESIKFLNFYATNSYYYFKDNMVDLIIYLIFKIENFTQEEINILLDFIDNYRDKYKKIDCLSDSLIIKIKNINPSEYLEKKFENLNDKNTFIETIYNYIKNTDFYKSKSKFYNFRPIFFNKTFQKRQLMLTAFKILMINNKIDLKKDFRISYSKITSRYSNYYLNYEYEKNFSYYLIEYEVALSIKKILYKSYEIINKYEENKKEFLKNKKSNSLTDKEKLELLPEAIKNYINKYSTKKTKTNNENIELNINFTKLNLIQNDTIDIHNTLTNIFFEEDEEIKIKTQNAIDENYETLNKKYIDFIEFLKQKNVWKEDELKNYCKNNKLMLNDAISTINDYYDNNYSDYLIEEENNLFYINNI